jgi:2-(1,2-epoxy-1,2-dihydrophenyl)acetyl-CoA isomerase
MLRSHRQSEQTVQYNDIRLEEKEGAFRLTFDRPAQLNSLSSRMQEEILDALGRVAEGLPRVLLITGSGRGFCAGQDLSERDVGKGPLDLGRGPEEFYNPLVRRLAALECPVVCAVNGVAAGAGVNIALSCDLVIAKRSARFVQAFSRIGLVPDAGGTWHLPRLVGHARALAFTLMSETWTAEQAQQNGLIWRAVDDEDFGAEVEAVMMHLATSPTFGLASSKRAIRQSSAISLDQALDEERDLQRRCGLTGDYKEGVTAFKEKRPPRFGGN